MPRVRSPDYRTLTSVSVDAKMFHKIRLLLIRAACLHKTKESRGLLSTAFKACECESAPTSTGQELNEKSCRILHLLGPLSEKHVWNMSQLSQHSVKTPRQGCKLHDVLTKQKEHVWPPSDPESHVSMSVWIHLHLARTLPGFDQIHNSYSVNRRRWSRLSTELPPSLCVCRSSGLIWVTHFTITTSSKEESSTFIKWKQACNRSIWWKRNCAPSSSCDALTDPTRSLSTQRNRNVEQRFRGHLT